MLAQGRHDAILRELELRGSLQAKGFAERLGVSAMTLRRDLQDLEAEGLLVRVHGGAVSVGVAAQRDPERTAQHPPQRPVATIGMIAPSASYYYPEVIRGARDAARALSCRLVLGTTNYSQREELRQVKRLIAGGIDALLITPSQTRIEGTPLHDLLTEVNFPVVVVERAVDEWSGGRVESIRTDHAYGAELAVRHLAELGHTRLALAVRDTTTSPWVVDGFTRATSRDGGSIGVLQAHIPIPRVGEDTASDALGEFLDDILAHQVTAAVVLPDIDAVALADLATDRGIRIPEDLSIIAYDDEIAGLGRVPLTAIAPPKYELGDAALRMCMARLRHPVGSSPAIARTALLPRLNVRESSAATHNVQ